MQLKLLPDNWEFTKRALIAGVIAIGLTCLLAELDRKAPPGTAVSLTIWAGILLMPVLALWVYLPRRKAPAAPASEAAASPPASSAT